MIPVGTKVRAIGAGALAHGGFKGSIGYVTNDYSITRRTMSVILSCEPSDLIEVYITSVKNPPKSLPCYFEELGVCYFEEKDLEIIHQ